MNGAVTSNRRALAALGVEQKVGQTEGNVFLKDENVMELHWEILFVILDDSMG